MVPESLTESFVGKLCEPKFHRARPWKLWWSEKRHKDERLLDAAEQGDADAIRQLLTQPADGGPPAAANAQQRHCKGRTALHLAVASENLEVVELLLQRGANVNARSRQGKLTPLHVAAAQGSVDLVEHLLAAHADVLMQTEDRQIALHYAAANGHSEVVKCLVHHDGNQLTYRNCFGQRPAEAASDASTAMMFRFAAHDAAICSLLGSRRHSACSDTSTATGSTATGSTATGSCASEAVDATEEDGYAERSSIPGGWLLRNARCDAVQRLLQKTRQLELETRQLMTARSWKASSPKDSPSRSPTSSCSSVTSRRTAPFAKMRRGSSRVEKVGPNSFELVNLLGRGSFGEVFQVKHKRTGKAYAMKVLQKSRIMSSNLLRYAVTERNILAYIRHPYIVSLHYAFQTPSHLVLVLHYCPRGNLQQLLTREKRLCETLSRLYSAEILLALIHLHERHTVFRDLKPDNVVIDESHHALLTDFGLSKEGVGQRGTKSFCGSVAFLAPEILLRKGHNHTVDIYNLGVLLYDMLTGLPPFYHHDRETLFANIKHARLEVPLYVSRVARAFIEATMEREPNKRLGAHHTAQVKDHAFFSEMDFEMLMRREVPVPEAHADEPSIPWQRSPLGLARAPESPFARADRAPRWRARYVRGPNGGSDRGVSDWDCNLDYSVGPSRGTSNLSSGANGSESSASTWRRGLPIQGRPSSHSSRDL